MWPRSTRILRSSMAHVISIFGALCILFSIWKESGAQPLSVPAYMLGQIAATQTSSLVHRDMKCLVQEYPIFKTTSTGNARAIIISWCKVFFVSFLFGALAGPVRLCSLKFVSGSQAVHTESVLHIIFCPSSALVPRVSVWWVVCIL